MTSDQVGSSVRRVGGPDRVTGQQRFIGDIRIDGMLHVKLVTVDCAHARIDGVKTDSALSLPGVHAVISAADLPVPMPRFGPVYRDRPILAATETKYHGEPVAAVVAETEQIADEAAMLVEVLYDELPAVATIAAAADPSAPLVQDPELRTGPHARTNMVDQWRFGWGSAESAGSRPGGRLHLCLPDGYPFRHRAALLPGRA